MAKRVRIYGPGLSESGLRLPLPDGSTSATVAQFLEPGPHELSWGKNTVHWYGGPGCPFLFVLEDYKPSSGPRVISY